MKWFKHFTNAHNDNAIKKIRIKYGADGYAIYWYCLELIAGDLDGTKATFELSHDAEVIGYDLKIDQLRVEEIMKYMISLSLFEANENKITCLKLAKFLDEKNTRNPEMISIIKQVKSTASPNLSATNDRKSSADKIRLDQNRKKHIYNSENSDGIIHPEPVAKKEKVINNNVPYQKIVDLYHKDLPELPRIEKLTPKRKSYIKQRWQNDLPDLNNWENFFDYIRQSKFLMGLGVPQDGRKVFIPNLEWLTNQNNYVKILEGKYHG